MIVVMRIHDFEFEPVNCPLPIHVDKGKMIGYLPVYETKEDAMEDYPDAKFLEAKEVQ